MVVAAEGRGGGRLRVGGNRRDGVRSYFWREPVKESNLMCCLYRMRTGYMLDYWLVYYCNQNYYDKNS